MNMRSYSCCKSDQQECGQVNSLSALLKLVGEESRLKILCILRQGQHCVCELEEHVKLSQSLISHHLRDLKDEGIIQDEKRGQWSHYSLTQKGKAITNSIFGLERINL